MTGSVPVGTADRQPLDGRDGLSAAGRRAARQRNWRETEACARALVDADPRNAEGYFLLGLAAAAAHRTGDAIVAYSRARALDGRRYDATVELAVQRQRLGEHGVAVRLLREVAPQLGNSPYYLDIAGTVFANAGLAGPAWHAYSKANALQPGLDALRARLAATSVHVGRIEDAVSIYEDLLARHPRHQRNHYELARLRTARDRSHVDQMLAVLAETRLPPPQNIYLYYALGKALEDLGEWDEAFAWYRKGGDAAASVAGYDVADDIRLIDAIIETCDADWLSTRDASAGATRRTPIFVVGLPRSGTTLVERILSGHSRVATAGESFFVPAALQQIAGEKRAGPVCADVVKAAARAPGSALAERYLAAIDYRLGDEALFVEKLPENFLYLGFLARAFPDAQLVHLRRHPMDACFAMFKQSFFRYAYTLPDLGRYYPAYRRLADHWQRVLGERVIEVGYEALATAPEATVRQLLERLGLPFERSCLEVQQNPAATNTASAAQVRERIHTRSVGRWRRFDSHLAPLADDLRAAGIDVSA